MAFTTVVAKMMRSLIPPFTKRLIIQIIVIHKIAVKICLGWIR